MKKRIVIDTQILNKRITGMGRVTKEILKELQENTNHEIIEFKGIKNKFFRSIFSQFFLPFFVLFKKGDFLLSPAGVTPLFKLPFYKQLVIIHDIRFMKYKNTFSLKSYLFMKFNFLKSIMISDKIITISKFSKNEIKKYAKKNNIKVIYNGINREIFYNENLNKKNFITFLGSNAKHKNLNVIIEAFELIKDKFPDYYLLIIGDKDYGLPESIKNENLEKVIFTGYINDSLVRKIFNQSKLFIFPSLYEGFGMPPLESIACNCPALVSNIDVMKEIFLENNIYFNPLDKYDLSNKISILLDNENKRNDLLKYQKQIIEKYSWSNWIQKFSKLLEDK